MQSSGILSTSLAYSLLFSINYASSSNIGGMVRPRKLTLISHPEGGDWNTARETCEMFHMSLATIDLHLYHFLVLQGSFTRFQKYAKEHFWIGLYGQVSSNGAMSVVTYRWEESCEAVTDCEEFWDKGQPQDNVDNLCVLASNTTLGWRNEKCNARHQYLCQTELERCQYNQTESTCTLYVTAPRRLTVHDRNLAVCMTKCENTHMDSLPCWGFTLVENGCVLFFQATQPRCGVTYQSSFAYLRTCFQLNYMKDLVNTTSAHVPAPDLPVVPLCNTSNNPAVQEPVLMATPDKSFNPTNEIAEDPQMILSEDEEPREINSASIACKTVARFVKAKKTFVAMPKCTCKFDREAVARTRSSLLTAEEKIKQQLSLDVKNLSSSYRKKHCAFDGRTSSRNIAYLGVGFLVVITVVIVVPDLAALTRHVYRAVCNFN